MKKIQIKICGLKDPANIEEVILLNPDYIGFILYRNSSRYVSFEKTRKITENILSPVKKVGVLVNEPFKNALKIAESRAFDLLQLHGNESVEYCKELSSGIGIIKAFSISDMLPENLKDYQPYCSLFLFDNAGLNYGGTGKKFDHRILSDYALDTEYILSGGISESDSAYVKSFRAPGMSGVDLNSRFEIKPGIKNIDLLRKFINTLRKNDFTC
jgi:phosphoribosylanthranilate isomerase